MSGQAGGQRSTYNNQTSSSMDPTSAGRLQGIWNAAQAAGNAGPSSLLTGAADYNSGMMRSGQLGAAALNGDQSAVGSLMNPFTSNVIDQQNKQWQTINQQTGNQLDANATAQGAFGGARGAIAKASALSQNNMQQSEQSANLRQADYAQAMQQAMGMAGMGFQGMQANSNLGMAGVGSPAQWMMNMLNQGYRGPVGQSSSSSGAQTGVNSKFDFTLPFLGGSGGK